MSFLRRLLGQQLLPGSVSDADGFVDVDVPLVAALSGATGHVFKCRGKVEGKVISFSVHLDIEWSEQPLGDSGSTVHCGTGAVHSTGTESDNLVGLLALRYGHNSYAERSMLPRVAAQVVCLSGNPNLLPAEDLRMKFFFHPEEQEDRYAEVFVNVGHSYSSVEFHEKDNGYRLPLLRALTEA
jgi:hypothetical protein